MPVGEDQVIVEKPRYKQDGERGVGEASFGDLSSEDKVRWQVVCLGWVVATAMDLLLLYYHVRLIGDAAQPGVIVNVKISHYLLTDSLRLSE